MIRKPSLPTSKCPNCFSTITLPPDNPRGRWLVLSTIIGIAAYFVGYLTSSTSRTLSPRNPTAIKATTRPIPLSPLKPAEPKRPRSSTWEELVERSGKPPVLGAGQAEQFEKGKLYQLDMFIDQIGEEFILAGTPFRNGRPYAIITFPQSEMDNVTADNGDLAQAIGRFENYRVVKSGLGTEQRYPVFEMVGLSNLYKKSFHSFEQ